MRFDIYCDESRPDLLGSRNPVGRYTVIGSLWLPTELRQEFKSQIHGIRNEYKVGGEFKWQKVSPSRIPFYQRIVDWFFEKGSQLRFRCIVIDREKVNLVKFHKCDQELGFYKFYYQMLHHWILDSNEYFIFCDYKANRDPHRLPVLKNCLNNANLMSQISQVQATRSDESVLIQLVDTLTGAVGAKFNNDPPSSSEAKAQLVHFVEEHIGHAISHTRRDERKFNIFVIELRGGW